MSNTYGSKYWSGPTDAQKDPAYKGQVIAAPKVEQKVTKVPKAKPKKTWKSEIDSLTTVINDVFTQLSKENHQISLRLDDLNTRFSRLENQTISLYSRFAKLEDVKDVAVTRAPEVGRGKALVRDRFRPSYAESLTSAFGMNLNAQEFRPPAEVRTAGVFVEKSVPFALPVMGPQFKEH